MPPTITASTSNLKPSGSTRSTVLLRRPGLLALLPGITRRNFAYAMLCAVGTPDTNWILGEEGRIHRGDARRSLDLGWALAATHCGAAVLRGISGPAEAEVLERSGVSRCAACEQAVLDGRALPSTPRPRPAASPRAVPPIFCVVARRKATAGNFRAAARFAARGGAVRPPARTSHVRKGSGAKPVQARPASGRYDLRCNACSTLR